jgi:hypothetical protein
VSGACSPNGGKEKYVIGGNARGKGTTKKTRNVGGWIIFRWIF